MSGVLELVYRVADSVQDTQQCQRLDTHGLLDQLVLVKLRDTKRGHDGGGTGRDAALATPRRSAVSTRAMDTLTPAPGVGAIASTARASELASWVVDLSLIHISEPTRPY